MKDGGFGFDGPRIETFSGQKRAGTVTRLPR